MAPQPQSDNQLVHLSEDVIDPRRLLDFVSAPECGAVASFEGRVRNHMQGREVRAVEYSGYGEMGIKVLGEIAGEALAQWPVHRIAIQHRLGLLELMESSVLIVVSSAHRAAAFSACRYVIEEIKVRLPVWKKEHFSDGESEWQLPSALQEDT